MLDLQKKIGRRIMLHELDQKYRYRFVVTLNFVLLFKNKFLVLFPVLFLHLFNIEE